MQPGHAYRLVSEYDVETRLPCGRCGATGANPSGSKCKRCGGFGDVVQVASRTKPVATDERASVLTVERIRPASVTDAQAREEGFGSADHWRDAFLCDHDCEWAWTITFSITTDIPRFLGHPEIGGATRTFGGSRRSGQDDYCSSPAQAIDDLETVDDATLETFVQYNHAKDKIRKLSDYADRFDTQAPLEEQLALVRRIAREKGVQIGSTERLIQQKINKIKRKLADAA